MTNNERLFEEKPYDPASMAATSLSNTKAAWFKRPWFLITVGVILISAVSIITDITNPLTNSQDVATQNGTIKHINSDTQACAYATTQSFQFYNDFVGGNLSSAEFSQASRYLVEDAVACSFASEPIYDLTNNIQPLETAAGKNINLMLVVSRTWMTDYALASIDDIQYLFQHPGTVSKIHTLTLLEADLTSERALAFKDVDAADRILGATLAKPAIPILPHLSGT